MDPRGATVLLTGASGGLGSAIARRLAAGGARLLLSGRDERALGQLAEELGAEVVLADLTDHDDVERLAEQARSCDVLVANAGVEDGPDAHPSSVDRSIDVNLRAPVVLARALARARLADGEPGRIVLVGSLSGLAATGGAPLYHATKFGLRGFSLAFAQELAGTSVTCTLVSPGFVRDAGMHHDHGAPLPRVVRTRAPEDVADAIVRAIEDHPLEVRVAPLELRAAVAVAAFAPRASAFAQRLLGVGTRRRTP